MSYTPGPWTIGQRIHYNMFASIMGADGHLIVNLGDGGNGIERQTANGQLIAAAPELLEALKEIVADHEERVRTYGDRETQPNRARVMNLAKIVIAKAEVKAVQSAKG